MVKQSQLFLPSDNNCTLSCVSSLAWLINKRTMIDLHYWPTPNGWKISIMLEECGLAYRLMPVNIGRGEQFHPDFLAISPNNRMPAIVDHSPGRASQHPA